MTANKSIAFLCHPYHRGGVTRWMADAAIAFARQGWQVYFVTVAPSVTFFSGKGRETLIQLIQKGDAAVKIFSESVGYEFEFGTQEYRAYIYRRQLQNVPPGTPVILSDDATVWDAAAPLYDTYPLVGVLHADEAYYYTLAEKYCCSLSVLVCVSERVRKTTIQRIPDIDRKIIHNIPCGINLPAVDFQSHGGDILQLVYVGRISEYQKRTGDLVKVCACLQQSKQAFHLDIIGDGPEKAALESKFAEAGLGPLVTFRGWLSQKEVIGRLVNSDIVLLTSDFEGTPIAMMEGLAMGCGLAGTRVSGIEDYEVHPDAADCIGLFSVGDIEDAVSKILKLAAVPISIRQQAARKLAESEFSMQVCLDKYAAAIDTIKAGSKAEIPKVRIPAGVALRSRAIALARYLRVSLTKR